MTVVPDHVHTSIGKAVLAAEYVEGWFVNAYYSMSIVNAPALNTGGWAE